ncbi:MAG: porphobilinogen synthase [Paracoccaceae bacterium]
MNFIDQKFPSLRFRRTRKNEKIRNLVSETSVSANDFIWPVFICDGNNIEQDVPSMPGVKRRSIDCLVNSASEAFDLGVPAICLFPYTEQSLKTEDCAEAWNPNNLSNKATRAIKKEIPELVVMSDVALDPYNINGHDGFVENGKILNDKTVEALVKQALSQAEAGIDVIGPSDMMDGRIGAIRAALEENGHTEVSIMSYAAKYSSSFYGPFRDAVGASGALTGDKKTYQMDIANSNEALRLVARDLKEGADMVMIKPGMPYLDICKRVKDTFGAPTFAYQVSGEYSMLSAAFEKGWLDRNKIIIETLMAFKRSGCDGILTYFAPEAAKLLK